MKLGYMQRFGIHEAVTVDSGTPFPVLSGNCGRVGMLYISIAGEMLLIIGILLIMRRREK